MALVLAIESDRAQADIVSGLLQDRDDTDVVVVGSKDAAVSAIEHRVPDLVLLGGFLSPRDEDAIIGHLRLLSDAAHLQTLTIPKLRPAPVDDGGARSFFGRKRRPVDNGDGRDPAQFATEVASYLARAFEIKAENARRRAEILVDAAEPVPAAAEPEVIAPVPPVHAVEHAAAVAEVGDVAGDSRLTAELERVRGEADQRLETALAAADAGHREEIARLEAEAQVQREVAVREAQDAAGTQATAALAAELERVRAEAEQRLADELAAADSRHRAEIAQVESEERERRSAAVRETQVVAESQTEALGAELAAAAERHRAEVARVEAEAKQRTAVAVDEARASAAAAATDSLGDRLEQVRDRAAQTLTAELAAAEQRHLEATARLEAEAEQRSAAAARNAEAVAEARAANELAAKLAEVRAEADHARAGGEQLRREPSERPVDTDDLDAVLDLPPTAPGVAEEEVVRTDYYALWRTRFSEGATASQVPVPASGGGTRRRMMLAMAATVFALLIGPGWSDSAPSGSPTLRVIDAGELLASAAARGVREVADVAADPGAAVTHWVDRRSEARGRLLLEALGLIVMLLVLRVVFFVGESTLWQGLVLTLGLVMLGYLALRAPWAALPYF